MPTGNPKHRVEDKYELERKMRQWCKDRGGVSDTVHRERICKVELEEGRETNSKVRTKIGRDGSFEVKVYEISEGTRNHVSESVVQDPYEAEYTGDSFRVEDRDGNKAGISIER